MSSSILKYGQVIRIRSYEKSKNTFITSKSYTDQNLYFQIYNEDDKIISNNNDLLNIINYRESLFQILPKSSFEINDQMNSQKTEAKKAESAPRAKTEEEQFKAMISQKRGKVISFGDKVIFRHLDSQYYMYGSFDCASSGIGAFKIELKKELSQKIIFQLRSYRTYEKEGDQMSIDAPFRIYHCETQCFVSYCLERIFVDSSSPRQKEMHIGLEKDYPVNPPFVKESYYEANGEDMEIDNPRNSKVQDALPDAGRFLIINENIPKRVFKFVVHNEFQMKINKQNIKNHDVVYFIHTKDDKYLCPHNFTSDIFLKKRKNQLDLNDIFDGLWEIQEIKTTVTEDKPNIPDDNLSLYKSKSPNKKKGLFGNLNGVTAGHLNQTYLTATVNPIVLEGAIGVGFMKAMAANEQKDGDKGKKKYILRHFSSGRIMYVSHDIKKAQLESYDRSQNKKPILLESIDAKFIEGALVQFTYKTNKSNQNSEKMTKYFLDIKRSKKQQKKDEMMEDSKEYMSEQNSILGEEELDEISEHYESHFEKDQLTLAMDTSEHGFRIYKISQEIKQLGLMVLSTQQIISKFTKLIEDYREIEELILELNVPLLNNVINVLKNLIGFIYDCQYSKIAESGNNPNSKKQRIFDELGMVELITRMLEQININDSTEKEEEMISFNSKNKIKPKKRLKQMENYDRNSEYKKVRTIYELGYKLLESIAANNDLMKTKISKYLEKYLNQIIAKSNKVVYRSIQEVLDGNILALEKISQGYIKNLIESFDINDPDPADLYFLSRLCICKERTVIKNQNAVFHNFYKEVEMKAQNIDESRDQRRKTKFIDEDVSANKFKFREDQQKMQILSQIQPQVPPQYRTLSELYQECNLMKSEGGYDPDKGHWTYFLQYLNLLADVCVQRNTAPLTYIEPKLPLKTLVAFIHEPTVKRNLLFQPFIRLVHHAFVQNSLYQEINRITKVKEWNELGDFNIPKAKRSVNSEIQKTMTLIMDYISRINKSPFELKKQAKQIKNGGDESMLAEPETIDFDPDDRIRLFNVKTFLQILKSTLNLGFWPEIEHMKKMVPYMLKVLRFDIEYANRVVNEMHALDTKNHENMHLTEEEYKEMVYGRIKQQLKLNKPNIVLLVECKILAAKILNIIIDYEYNVRVSMITKYFKDVMEMDVDLTNYAYDKVAFMRAWRSNLEYELFAPMNDKQGYLLNQNLWKDKVLSMLDQRNIFSECIAENINYLLVLFEGFIYSNEELTNLSLQLIDRVTNQRRSILNSVKDIILVAGGHLSQLATRGVQVARSVLLSLTSIPIRDASFHSSPNLLWNVVMEGEMVNKSRALGAVQQLASLTMSMMKSKANPTLEDASKFYDANELYPFYDIRDGRRDELSVDGSYLIISEKDQNIPLNQNLIKSQDHHLLIIDFIKIMEELPDQQLPIRALHAAYNFLTVLVWNHSENKKELEEILKISEFHLETNVGCIDFYKQMYTNNKKLVKKSQIKSIINRVIDLANNQSIDRYLKSKLLDFLRVVVIFDDNGYDINQNLVMEIISQKQVSSENNIVYLKAENQIGESLSNLIEVHYEMWINQYKDQYKNASQTYEPLNVSPQLFYVATFFEVFSALIQSQNVVNIGKASNMHPIDFLLTILDRSQNCWIVVRHLRAYLNKLYYFSRRQKDTSMFEMFNSIDLPIIKKQLRWIVELIHNASDFHTIRIRNPIRYSYLGSYVFLTLEEILHSLYLLFTQQNYSKYIIMLLSQAQDQVPRYALNHLLLQIIQMLQYLLKTIDGRLINKYMSKVSKSLKFFVSNTPLEGVQSYTEATKKQITENISKYNISSDDIPFKKSYTFHQNKGFWRHLIDWNSFINQQELREKDMGKVQKRQDPNPNQSKQAEKQRKRDYLLDVIYLGNIDKKIQKIRAKKSSNQGNIEKKKEESSKIGSNLPKNVTTSQSNRFKVKNERFDTADIKNNVINTRRKKLVKFLEVNPQFRRFSEEQIQQHLYGSFSILNELSKQKYNGSIIVGNADVIKSIVKMNEIDSNSIRSEYKLLIIRFLTNYIQRQSQIFKGDIQNWYVDKEQSQKIRNHQNFLNECGCANFLCSLIINDLRFSIEMSNAILLFGIVLVIGQNEVIQNEIFKLISQDERNVFLSQLNTLIKDCGSTIASHVIGGEIKEYSSAMNYSDTYDFYIDNEKIMKRKFVYVPETVEEQKQFDEKVTSMQFAFVFLKNLCEGNKQIKNYIREQVNTDEEKKPKADTINFMSIGVSELRRMFLNFNINIVKVPFSIIDFINEITQIPCINNQLLLCDSSFFHDFAALQIEVSMLLEEKRIAIVPQNISIIFQLFSCNIKNIISCLEGNVLKIYQLLSADSLCRYFVEVLAFYLKYLPVLEGFQEKISSAKILEDILNRKKLHQNYYQDLFQVVSVIIKLRLKTPLKKQFNSSILHYLKKNSMNEYLALLETNLLGIEITMDEYELTTDRNQILFFPKHNVFNYLSRSTRNFIMEQVDRSTQRDKIIGLLGAQQEIKEEINYNYYLDKEYKPFNMAVAITNSKIQSFLNYGLMTSTLICALMLYFSAVVYFPYEDVIQYDLGPENTFVKLLSYIQFGLAIIYLFLWSKTHVKLAIQKYVRAKNKPKDEDSTPESALLKILLKVQIIKSLYCLIKYDSEFGTVLLFMFGSLMGTFYRLEWFSILLINLLMARLEVLKNILKALKESMGMLGTLSLFGASFISIFSIFSMSQYSQSLYPDIHPKDYCMSVSDCIIELYIREEIANDMDTFKSGRFIYDMIYVIFIDTLFGEIVGGVLIDNFANLRIIREERQKDRTEKCFICGIDKETLEKRNNDLKTHYKGSYHKLWNYVFYLYYLGEQKKKTGLEQIIQSKYSDEDVSWIPSADEKESDIGELIEYLENPIKEQTQLIKSIEAKE